MNRIITTIVLSVFILTGFCHAEITHLTIDEAVTTLDKSKLRVHFIDVGTGLAVFIQTPDNHKNIFLDGGEEAGDKIIDYVNKFHPEDSDIDFAIVTHADSDHFYGMMKIFDNWVVKEFWNTGYDSDKLKATGRWKTNFLTNRVLRESGCNIKMPLNNWFQAGDTIVVDDSFTFKKDRKLFFVNKSINQKLNPQNVYQAMYH